ncbi:hypothetical protein CEXT_542041 [Caerostris extrusa]|uniref:Uncharacterized protein n=1 Tax=Caerostris extrusa TaxID=172846 RepID=A0AAV4PC57_CAEEX|nr:hypothetical protein CEXT_542041 [Caerostris extrusa]
MLPRVKMYGFTWYTKADGTHWQLIPLCLVSKNEHKKAAAILSQLRYRMTSISSNIVDWVNWCTRSDMENGSIDLCKPFQRNCIILEAPR